MYNEDDKDTQNGPANEKANDADHQRHVVVNDMGNHAPPASWEPSANETESLPVKSQQQHSTQQTEIDKESDNPCCSVDPTCCRARMSCSSPALSSYWYWSCLSLLLAFWVAALRFKGKMSLILVSGLAAHLQQVCA